MLCCEEEFEVEASGVEPFGCAIAIFLEVKGMVSGLSVVYLLVASQILTPLSHAYNFITLISVLQNMF